MKQCPSCGASCPDSSAFCPACGAALGHGSYQPIYNSHFNITEQNLPEKYRPLGMWSYFFYGILYAVPFIGLIFLIIHSLSDKNINRRNYARSFFCWLILLAVITAASILSGGVIGVLSNLSAPVGLFI